MYESICSTEPQNFLQVRLPHYCGTRQVGGRWRANEYSGSRYYVCFPPCSISLLFLFIQLLLWAITNTKAAHSGILIPFLIPWSRTPRLDSIYRESSAQCLNPWCQYRATCWSSITVSSIDSIHILLSSSGTRHLFIVSISKSCMLYGISLRSGDFFFQIR